MDKVLPIRRFVSWVIDRLLFFAAGAAVLYLIQELDSRLGISGPKSVNVDLQSLLTVQAPLALVVTYALWMLIIIKFGQPGRRLTATEVRQHRGGSAGRLRMLVRTIIKIPLHLSLIGLIIDAVFILRDQRERRSIPDILAGTVIAQRRR